MSRLFLPNRFFNTRWRRFSLFTRSDHKQSCVFFQQQLVRRTRSSSSSSSSSSRPTSSWSFRSRHSRVWLCCGIGAGGLALALGLKYHTDDATNDGSQQCDDVAQVCDHNNSHVPASQMAAIEFSRKLLERLKAEVAAPGFVVGVSIDGSTVWRSGVGYADMENNVTCRPDTMMRIASISKPLTAAAAARLCEEGKLDLDVPVQHYVPEFPAKQFDGEDVTITSRMILSHLSGIRHYEKDGKKVREAREKAKRPLKPPSASEKKCSAESVDKPTQEDKKSKDAKPPQRKKEFENEEYYLKDNYDSVIQAMDLFKDDPLIFKPGTTFLYSTHAFTLLSAVVERAAGQRFLDHMTNMFRELGMLNTVPDENDPIIYNRSRFYHLNKKGRVVNCPYVDNSYKWAGGGFLSTVADLLLFGNAMLYSYQLAQLKDPEGFLLPGFLKPQTVLDMWSPVDKTEGSWDKEGLYAQGWLAVESLQKYGQCRRRRHYVSHTGGAVGASSVLLVLPSEEAIEPDGHVPQGVVVAIMMNMQSVGLNSAALKIAQEFEKAKGDIVTASRPPDLRQRPNIMSL